MTPTPKALTAPRADDDGDNDGPHAEGDGYDGDDQDGDGPDATDD